MALTSTRWRGIARLQSASENTPPMRFGEPDHNAAVVLQEVLIENGFSLPSGPDGIYGRQTAAAVQAAEVQFGLDTDQGVAGREVLGALDSANAAPTFEAALARLDAPFALLKVQAALDALNAIPTPIIQADGTRVTIAQTTDDALQIHFRLINNAVPTIGELPLMTDADLTQMRDTYNGIVRRLRNADTIFRDGVPTLGIRIPAESFLDGPTNIFPPPGEPNPRFGLGPGQAL